MRTCGEVSIATALTACLSPVTRCGGLGSDKPSRAAAVFSVCRRAACWYGRLRCCWLLHAPTVHSTRLRVAMPLHAPTVHAVHAASVGQAGGGADRRSGLSESCVPNASTFCTMACVVPATRHARMHARTRTKSTCVCHALAHAHMCVHTHASTQTRAQLQSSTCSTDAIRFGSRLDASGRA